MIIVFWCSSTMVPLLPDLQAKDTVEELILVLHINTVSRVWCSSTIVPLLPDLQAKDTVEELILVLHNNTVK